MQDDQPQGSEADQGLRRMITWVAVALVLTLLFAAVVVELTVRWFM
jgi:hypothetical protein